MTWVVLASGQSLTKEDVEYARQAREDGRIKGFIAVSNVGIDLAPDADALVSHDGKWWANNREASGFEGRKFCNNTRYGIEVFHPSVKGCNSGLMAMEVSFRVYGANKIILLGFDMHGTHYFGQHPKPLNNTTITRFKAHIKQFNNWKYCEVINCTPNSSLKKFPLMNLREVI